MRVRVDTASFVLPTQHLHFADLFSESFWFGKRVRVYGKVLVCPKSGALSRWKKCLRCSFGVSFLYEGRSLEEAPCAVDCTYTGGGCSSDC